MKSEKAIPKHWKLVTLDDVAAKVPNAISDGPFGSNMKTSDYVAEGCPVLQGKNITNDSFRWLDVRFISEGKAEELKRSKVRLGDILIVKIGSIGYSAILDDLQGHKFAVIPANLAKVTPNKDCIDTRYLYRWLTSVESKRFLVGSASTTAQPALSLGKIKNLPVPLAPLPEQRRIAAILDKADALRQKRRVALAKLDELLQSVFVEMFGDPATNPKGWKLMALGDIAEKFSDGPFGSNLKSSHYTNDGVRVIRLQNIGIGRLVDSDRAYISEGHYASLPRNHCLPGDVIIGTLGEPNLRAMIMPESIPRALNKADCVQLRPNRSIVDAEFISALLNNPGTIRLAHSMMHGQTRVRIAGGQLKQLAVPIPPLALQKKFTAVAVQIEAQLVRQKAAQSESDGLFASLQARAFAGDL